MEYSFSLHLFHFFFALLSYVLTLVLVIFFFLIYKSWVFFYIIVMVDFDAESFVNIFLLVPLVGSANVVTIVVAVICCMCFVYTMCIHLLYVFCVYNMCIQPT